MRPSALLTLALLLLAGLAGPAISLPAQSTCGPPPPIFASTQPNIFSEQQEQWLGEAMADYGERYNRPVKNPELNAYLKTIGARLLAVLPPTAIQFQFTLVESSEVNGFSLAGGHVYLTRKLVASARNEDEIAGVIAHEMGHILTHQFAIETTAGLHKLLGVSQVGDRADIYAKFQRLVDAQQHQKHQADADSDDKQDQADQVAVYASAAAGYRPQAYAEFWDRSFFVGGKTGSHLGDFFGSTTPSQKRLRTIRGIVAKLPPGCGTAIAMAATPAFTHWQKDVLEDQAVRTASATANSSPGASVPTTARTGADTPLQLTPPLRLDIERLRFSRDGKYILAQDESSIFILSRDPFKEVFRFDGEHALPAEFTPDSQEVVISTSGLHVERWNIAQQKLVSAHEVVAQQSCVQTQLSPDGRTIVCVYFAEAVGTADSLGISLIDAETGAVLFRKKPWFLPNYNFEFTLFLRRMTNDRSDILSSSLSADGNLLLIGAGADRLAFDLRSRTPIKIDGALKNWDYPNSYAFLGSDKVVAVNRLEPDRSGVFSFPDGRRVRQFKLGLPYMHTTAGGAYVLTEGPKGSVSAAADVNTGKYVAISKSAALDILEQSVVSENLDGTIFLNKLGGNDARDRARASLSLSPLAAATSARLSADGRYLALSERTRGTIWDLQTGKSSILMRGFRNSWWSPDGRLLAEFPPHDNQLKMISTVRMTPLQAADLTYKLPDNAYLDEGHLFEWKQNKKGWDLFASSPFDASAQWTRSFSDGRPGFTTNLSDTDLIFSYPLQSPIAKEKLRADSALRDQAGLIKQKAAGRIIELVDSANGSPRSQVAVEVPLTYDGVAGFNRVGDLLYLSTGDNRTIVYSFKTGAQLRQLFGTVIAADAKSGRICINNRRGEVTVLDKSGAELQHRSFDTTLRYAALRNEGALLVVLTADQRVYHLDLGPS